MNCAPTFHQFKFGNLQWWNEIQRTVPLCSEKLALCLKLIHRVSGIVIPVISLHGQKMLLISKTNFEGNNTMTIGTTRTALITGASRGLGLALARRLSTEGWQLIIDARGAEALEAAGIALAKQTRVIAIAGDVTESDHRRALVVAARDLGGLDALVNNASLLGPSPQPELLDYPLEVLERVYRTNVIAPLALFQALRDELKPGACVINITSDAGVEAYEGWGGYGSSKAGLEQLSNILAAENPALHVYWVDPGDMRTQMHQEAFPGEDISDRPLPEESVPGFVELLKGVRPSGRYSARVLSKELD